jgi:hypothetical protein
MCNSVLWRKRCVSLSRPAPDNQPMVQVCVPRRFYGDKGAGPDDARPLPSYRRKTPPVSLGGRHSAIEAAHPCSRACDSLLQVAFDACTLLVRLREAAFGLCDNLPIREGRFLLVGTFLTGHLRLDMALCREQNKGSAAENLGEKKSSAEPWPKEVDLS